MWRVIIVYCLSASQLNAQEQNLRIKLSKELNEISGLAVFNDTVLMAINDSGNTPDLYFLKTDGTILKKTRLEQNSNVDWEDLTKDDKGNVFIADVGNNSNDRKDLHFLKFKAIDAYQNDSIKATEIWFSYADQQDFPPGKANLNFNCEAVFWANDSLYLLTKNESKDPKVENDHWNRDPNLYVMPAMAGTHIATRTNWLSKEMFKVKTSGVGDLITGSVVIDNKWYVLTYRHLFISRWGTTPSERQLLKHKKFSKLKQREAITAGENGTLYIGAEKHKVLGGPYLYIRTL